MQTGKRFMSCVIRAVLPLFLCLSTVNVAAFQADAEAGRGADAAVFAGCPSGEFEQCVQQCKADDSRETCIRDFLRESLSRRVTIMADKRTFDPALFAELLKYKDDFSYWEEVALTGPETCAAMRETIWPGGQMKMPEALIEYEDMLYGLKYCSDQSVFEKLVPVFEGPIEGDEFVDDYELRIAAYSAISLSLKDEEVNDFAAYVSAQLHAYGADSDAHNDTFSDEAELALYALHAFMQAIAYKNLSPEDIPALDVQRVVELALPNDQEDMSVFISTHATYLLFRMKGLGAYLPAEKLYALATYEPESRFDQYHMLQLIGQIGNDTSVFLIEEARKTLSLDGKEGDHAVGAIRSLGQLSDDESRIFLLELVADQQVREACRQAAMSSLVTRLGTDAEAASQDEFLPLMRRIASNEDGWMQVAAVEAGVSLLDASAVTQAKRWVEQGSYYQAFRSIGMLASSEDGKKFLERFVANSKPSARRTEAVIALDPAGFKRAGPRPVSDIEYRSYGKNYLVLETSKGSISIDMFNSAAARNFMEMAQEGDLDGMLWHRVVPGFVAQAGQRDTLEQYEHGTLRDEPSSTLLMGFPDAVGVATAGRDTGSTQFFINLEHNLHLESRYTIIGRVVDGDYYALEEGDVIIRAYVER